MHRYPVAWGLDIGHASIKAVKVQRLKDQVSVLAYTIEPIAIPEGGDRDEALITALQQMAAREEFGDTPVVAALSGRQVWTKTVNIPLVGTKNVERMVELEARQQVPGDFDDVEWGYHTTPAADGASLDVALFAVKREIAQDLVAKTKRTGLNLVGISVSSLGLYNFVRYDQEFPEEETVIILDVGAENTDLVLYQGEGLWMRTLAVSGNDITKAFMKKFRVSFEEAEQLKRQAVDSRQADKIIKVIEASLGELASEVQRSLGFYKQQNKEAKLENLVISGSTFRLPGLPEYMAERLRYQVNILEDLDKIKVANGLERDHFMHDLQSLGVAMGLALQGTGAARANVDLMPADLQLERVLRSKRWAGVLVAGALAATLTVDLSVAGSVFEQNNALVERAKKNFKEFTGRQSEARTALDEVPKKAQELKAFDPYGAHQGVIYGIAASVVGVLQDVIKERGRIEVDLKDKDRTNAPLVQAAYLRSLTIPEVPWFEDSGPFRPLAKKRDLILEVSIPRDAKPDEVSRQVIDRLKALPVPGMGADPAARLFSDVQARGTRLEDETYWVIDRNHVDPDTKNPKPLEEERKVKASVFTFVCTLNAPAPAPAPEVKP